MLILCLLFTSLFMMCDNLDFIIPDVHYMETYEVFLTDTYCIVTTKIRRFKISKFVPDDVVSFPHMSIMKWSEKKISRNFGIIRVPDCVRANFKGTIEERQTRLCTTIFEPLNCKSEESYFSNFVFQFNEKPVPSTPIPAKEPPKNKDTSIYTYIGVGISLFVLVVIVQGVLIFTYKRRASATVQKLLGVINNEVESSIAMRPKMLLPHELEPIQEVRRVKVTKITSTTSRQFAKSHNDVQHPSKPYNSRIPVHSLPTTGRLLPQTPEAHNFRGNVPTKPYQSGINNGYLDEESL